MPLLELAKISLMVFGMILAFRAVTLVGANTAASESIIALKSDPSTTTTATAATTTTTPSSSSSSILVEDPNTTGTTVCNGDCFPSEILGLVVFYHWLMVLFATTAAATITIGEKDELEQQQQQQQQQQEEEDFVMKWIMTKLRQACFWGIVVPIGYFLCVFIIGEKVDYNCHCRFLLWKNLLFAFFAFVLVQFLFNFGSCFVKAISQVHARTRGIISSDTNSNRQLLPPPPPPPKDNIFAPTAGSKSNDPRSIEDCTSSKGLQFAGYDSMMDREQLVRMVDSTDNDYERGEASTESNSTAANQKEPAREKDPFLPVFTTAAE